MVEITIFQTHIKLKNRISISKVVELFGVEIHPASPKFNSILGNLILRGKHERGKK